jgi:hypothetical protein
MPQSENWKGVEGATEHRTVGSHRAWCYQDGEWCGSSQHGWCDCCYEAAGYVKTWVKPPLEERPSPPATMTNGPYVPLIARTRG